MVEELAQQKREETKQEQNRKTLYQALIFGIAYALSFCNNMRQQYIYECLGCRSGKCLVTAGLEGFGANNVVGTACDSFSYSITISAGIGFIFLGNVYDNIDSPRRVTTALLCTLAVIALVEAIFSGPSFQPQD